MAASNTTAMFTHEVLEAVADDAETVEGGAGLRRLPTVGAVQRGACSGVEPPEVLRRPAEIGLRDPELRRASGVQGVRLRPNEAIEDFGLTVNWKIGRRGDRRPFIFLFFISGIFRATG